MANHRLLYQSILFCQSQSNSPYTKVTIKALDTFSTHTEARKQGLQAYLNNQQTYINFGVMVKLEKIHDQP